MSLVKNVIAIVLMAGSAHAQDNLLEILEQAETQKAKTQNVAEHLKLKELRAIIGSDSGDTNIFLQRLFASDYQGALLTFKEAVAGTQFAKSQGAQALHAFLLWQNGLRLQGLEQLVAIQDLKTIAPLILDFWRPQVKTDSREWRVVKLSVSDSWGAFFGSPSQKDQVQKWQEATTLAARNEVDKAAKILGILAKEPDPYVEKDLINLTAGRLLYQRGYLDAAIRYYNMIGKGSDLWVVAQEEAAWAHMRKAEVGKALAITTSLTHEKLSRDVGPETIFLHSLLNLKVCNYPQAIQALKTYKERFRPRVVALQKLIDEDANSKTATLAALALAEKNELSMVALGSHNAVLPRAVGVDRQLKQDGLVYGILKAEARAAGQLFSASLEKGSQVGFDGSYETLKNKIQARENSALAGFNSRVKALAQAEVQEISVILQKMHIVEAEVIQQTGLAQRVAIDTTKSTAKSTSSQFEKVAADQVRFAGDKEIWFDELTHYKIKVAEGCRGKSL